MSAVPTGEWLETVCNEGPYGPDLPPPTYFKGVIRFADRDMFWSSRLFDDKDCSIPRPDPSDEVTVPFTVIEDFKTTDGSIAIDLTLPDLRTRQGTPMYGLFKIDGERFWMGIYPTNQPRPAALDPEQAQQFLRP